MIVGRRYIAAMVLSAVLSVLFFLVDLSKAIEAEGVYSYIIVAEIFVSISPLGIFLNLRSSYTQVLVAFSAIWFLMVALLFFGTLMFFPLAVVLALVLLFVAREKGIASLNLMWISLAAFLVMVAVSGILRVDSVTGLNQILAFSIYNDENPAGVPLLFYDGIIFQGPLFVYTFSLPTFVVYSVISVVLSKNYVLIYRTYVKTKLQVSSLVSGAATVLSCQCEGITGTLPSIAALAVSTLVVPVLMEGTVLVILTLVVLVFIAGKSTSLGKLPGSLRRIPPVAFAAGFMIFVPILETIAVAMGLLPNPIFFFGINFLMFLNGIFLFMLVQMALGKIWRSRNPIALTLISSALMIIWLVPFPVSLAEKSPLIFVVMNLCMIAAGILAYYAYAGFSKDHKILFLEYLSMMFAMTGLTVLYLSSFSGITIWGVFSFSSQLVFALVLVAVSLPIMWFITNLSLIRYASQPQNESAVHPN